MLALVTAVDCNLDPWSYFEVNWAELNETKLRDKEKRGIWLYHRFIKMHEDHLNWTELEDQFGIEREWLCYGLLL